MTSEPIRCLEAILLDTGPFCRFCEADALDEFAAYLDERAWITQDVAGEIHLGEITTVIAAVARGMAPVMIDDRFGRDLATQRGLALYSTADLAVEMTAMGHLDPNRGWTIFRSVFHEKRARFDEGVQTMRKVAELSD